MLELNQELLQVHIEKLEDAYIDTTINIIKIPFLIQACEKDIKNLPKWDKKKEQLEKTIEMHKINEKANREAIEQYEWIIPEVLKLKK